MLRETSRHKSHCPNKAPLTDVTEVEGGKLKPVNFSSANMPRSKGNHRAETKAEGWISTFSLLWNHKVNLAKGADTGKVNNLEQFATGVSDRDIKHMIKGMASGMKMRDCWKGGDRTKIT